MRNHCLIDTYILKTVNRALKEKCRAFVCALIIILATSLPVNVSAEKLTILITYSDEKSFVKTITNHLINNLEINNVHIKTEVIDSNNIINADELANYKLIVALGSNTTEKILQLNIKTPLLSLLIPKQSIDTLQLSSHPDQPWATLLLDQPIERQFLLIKHLLGKNRKIGTLLSPHSVKLKNELLEASKKTSLKLNTHEIENDSELLSYLELLTSKVDVLLTIPDPIAFNRKTIRSILLLTYRNGIPVIGFSKSYVKAGAIAAIYSEPEQISKQAAEIIEYYFDSHVFNNKIYQPNDYTILTNHMVARTLGIELKSEQELLENIKHDEQEQ